MMLTLYAVIRGNGDFVDYGCYNREIDHSRRPLGDNRNRRESKCERDLELLALETEERAQGQGMEGSSFKKVAMTLSQQPAKKHGPQFNSTKRVNSASNLNRQEADCALQPPEVLEACICLEVSLLRSKLDLRATTL